jgi:KaiC/GvpD/RAD55 family RecA-like ATPase
MTPGARGRSKEAYAFALELQGQVDEARKLRAEAQAVKEDLARRFDHVNLRTVFMAPINVVAGREFETRLDIVNPSRAKGSLIRIENLILPEFDVLSVKPKCSINNGLIEITENVIEPFVVKTVKLKLKARKTGTFTFSPRAVYIDDLGQTRTSISNSVLVTTRAAEASFETLPGRLPTGTAELDQILLGGIPQNYAIILAGPSSEEKEMIINRFLKTGAEAGETTFYVTSEAESAKKLVETHSSNFYLILCNPQADGMIKNLSNVFKLKGVESLTEIDIALAKAIRLLNPSATTERRIYLDVLSDVLLQHHAVVTRKWLGALLPNLKSQGFTILATINPGMHLQEEVQAMLGLFQGEINIFEKESATGLQIILRVSKLLNQKHSEKEIILPKER